MAVPEILLHKWTKLFHYRDADGDGLLRKVDYELYTENFVKIYGERALPVRQVADIVWPILSLNEGKLEITLTEFLEAWSYFWTNDQENLDTAIKRYLNLCFDAIDTNGDGFISLEEYTVYQNSFGITNQDYIDHIFSRMDRDGDRHISRDEFVQELIDYVFSESPERIPELYDHRLAKTFRKSGF